MSTVRHYSSDTGSARRRQSKRRVAVLGAGIMGSCVALSLAQRRMDVTIFDAKEAPMSGASRWNEGKIHLGYLYAADPTLETAQKLLTGGLNFVNSLSRQLDGRVEDAFTHEDDIYLIHKNSVVPADEIERYFRAVGDLVRKHDALENASKWLGGNIARPVSDSVLCDLADKSVIQAGFQVPERSANTNLLADRLCAALNASGSIELRMRHRIVSATPVDSIDGPWEVTCADGVWEQFDTVINALWNGRLAIDRSAGLELEQEWSHRFRVALFARTSEPVRVPSSIVTVGPFGDVKNYNDRDFYISWYPVGLQLDSGQLDPQEPKPFSQEKERTLAEQMVSGLETAIPSVREIWKCALEFKVRGGFVFAAGRGSLADRYATIHRRDNFGARHLGRYHSIDTGKYSTAPWIAERLANLIANI